MFIASTCGKSQEDIMVVFLTGFVSRLFKGEIS